MDGVIWPRHSVALSEKVGLCVLFAQDFQPTSSVHVCLQRVHRAVQRTWRDSGHLGISRGHCNVSIAYCYCFFGVCVCKRQGYSQSRAMPELAAAVFEGHLQVHIPVDSCGIKSHSCSKTELAGILAGLFMCLDPSRLRDLLFSKLEGAWPWKMRLVLSVWTFVANCG